MNCPRCDGLMIQREPVITQLYRLHQDRCPSCGYVLLHGLEGRDETACPRDGTDR